MTHNEPLDDVFCTVPLVFTETVWCVPRGHAMAEREAVSMEDLREEPLVLFQKNFFHYEIIMRRFQEAGIEPKIIHATDQLSTMHHLIQRGIATGFLLKSALCDFPDLVGVPLSPPSRVQISLVWEKSRHLTADMRCLIEDYRKLEL